MLECLFKYSNECLNIRDKKSSTFSCCVHKMCTDNRLLYFRLGVDPRPMEPVRLPLGFYGQNGHGPQGPPPPRPTQAGAMLESVRNSKPTPTRNRFSNVVHLLQLVGVSRWFPSPSVPTPTMIHRDRGRIQAIVRRATASRCSRMSPCAQTLEILISPGWCGKASGPA